MKNQIIFKCLFFAVLLFSACKKDKDMTPEPDPLPETTVDLAKEVVGEYMGRVLHEGTLYLDDYKLTISKVSETRIRCKGDDNKIPAFETDIAEAPEISGVDWITQPNTYQLDSVFTYVRAEERITIIRKELNIEFYGVKE